MADGLTNVRADTILMRMILEGQEYGIKEENEILKDKAVAKAKLFFFALRGNPIV